MSRFQINNWAKFNCLNNPNPTPGELKNSHLNSKAASANVGMTPQSDQSQSLPKNSSSSKALNSTHDLNPNNWQIASGKSRQNAKNSRASVEPVKTTIFSVPDVVTEPATMPENTCLNPEIEDENESFDINLIDKRSTRQNVVNTNPICLNTTRMSDESTNLNFNNSAMSDGVVHNNGQNVSLFDFDNPVESDASSMADQFEKSLMQLDMMSERLSKCLDDSFDP